MRCSFLSWCVLLSATMVLIGCDVPIAASSPPLLERFLFDVSPSTGAPGATEARAIALVESRLPELVHRGGTAEFYVLDDVQGALLVGRFLVGQPARESRSFLARFEQERLAEGQRSFRLLHEAIFTHPSRTSPLALALSVMSMGDSAGKEVRYYLQTDGVESVLADFGFHPPGLPEWQSRLRAADRAGLQERPPGFGVPHPRIRVPPPGRAHQHFGPRSVRVPRGLHPPPHHLLVPIIMGRRTPPAGNIRSTRRGLP